MAERLPFGQITPAAQPVGAFLKPAQFNIPEVARPALLDAPTGISTIQQNGVSSFSTPNEYAQITEALAPFSRELSKVVSYGIESHATAEIEEGYKQAMNLQVKGMLTLQERKEEGAAQAAASITELERKRKDEVAANLLRNTNSFRAVGARRAFAQQAAGQIDNAMADDLANNQGLLSQLAPGSPELTARKNQIVQQVYSDNYLTGDETEAFYYVLPELNKSWDKFTSGQQSLYEEQLKATTIAKGTAVLGQMLSGFGQNGVPTVEGMVPVTDKRFGVSAGLMLTQELDSQLRLLGGKDKAEALRRMREQLVAVYGQIPGLDAALQNIRTGPATTLVTSPDGKQQEVPVPFRDRPSWGGSAPLEMLELKNKGNAARQQDYELGQKAVEQGLDGLWWQKGMPGSMLPGDPGYPAALLDFRNQAAAAGYRDIDGYMKGRMQSLQSVAEQAYPADPFAGTDFETQLNNLPNSAFSTPEKVEALLTQAKGIASAEPTLELRSKRYAQLTDSIRKRQERAQEITPGLQSTIDKALVQDLGLPAVKALVDKAKAKRGGGGSMFQSAMAGGAGTAVAVEGLGSAEVSAFTQRVNNLYLRNSEAAIDAWRAKNPGVPLTSSARNVLISGAIAETRKSDEYKDAYADLTGKKPGQAGAGPAPRNNGQLGPSVRGVERSAAAELPDSTARAYQGRVVLSGGWLRDELVNVGNGKPVSPQLYGLAKTAGTTTDRYLLEQLRFYPQLDPDGGIGKVLERRVRDARMGREVSSANINGVLRSDASGIGNFNPLAPGSWLMNMLMPPAAAATLPPNFGGGYNGGGGGGGGQWERGPAVAASHADSGSGYTIPGARDANGRPPIFSRGGANAFAAMVRDSGGVVKASDIASSQRSAGKNAAVGGVNGSEHLKGNAMDIHGKSEAWIRKNGAKYGWYIHDYAGSHGGHVEFRGGGSPTPQVATRKGGGMTGLATYYNGSGGSDGVAGGPTANGEKYDPNGMTAAVQWSLRGKYMNKWVKVEDMDSGKTVRVWVNDVGQMGGTERSVNKADPRVIDLSPAAFRKLFGSTQRGVGRIRILPG